MIVLDSVDRRIISLLQLDGRLSVRSIADEVGLSRTAVQARVDRLVRSRAFRITAFFHPYSVGLRSIAHISIDVQGSAYSVASAVARFEDAPFVSVVAGNFGVVTEMRCRDIADLSRAIEEIEDLPGVIEVESFLYTQIIKDANLPLAVVSDLVLGPPDFDILKILQDDGRSSYSAIGKKIGLSAVAVRNRIYQLRKAGVLHIGALVNSGLVGITRMMGVELKIEGPPGRKSELLTRLSDMAEISYLATGIGRYDAIATISTSSDELCVHALERVRQTDGVTVHSTWVHLQLIKERY